MNILNTNKIINILKIQINGMEIEQNQNQENKFLKLIQTCKLFLANQFLKILNLLIKFFNFSFFKKLIITFKKMQEEKLNNTFIGFIFLLIMLICLLISCRNSSVILIIFLSILILFIMIINIFLSLLISKMIYFYQSKNSVELNEGLFYEKFPIMFQ